VNENIEEVVIPTVQIGEYVQTMGRQAVTVVFPEVIAEVIANVIPSWWERLLSNLR
jgi:hypothetical protein